MKCSYCENNKEVIKCLSCGCFACKEHTYFVRDGSKLTPVCIDCYEKVKSDRGK